MSVGLAELVPIENGGLSHRHMRNIDVEGVGGGKLFFIIAFLSPISVFACSAVELGASKHKMLTCRQVYIITSVAGIASVTSIACITSVTSITSIACVTSITIVTSIAIITSITSTSNFRLLRETYSLLRHFGVYLYVIANDSDVCLAETCGRLAGCDSPGELVAAERQVGHLASQGVFLRLVDSGSTCASSQRPFAYVVEAGGVERLGMESN